jgi:glucose-1-phosphate cytidylyltransferase
MKCAIFCGGKGTRMGSSSDELPKTLINVGNKPILEHIMDHYASYGITDFILCLGYQGDKIREYFSKNPSNYNVEMVETGEDSKKAERLLKVKDLVGDEFFVSYGDDLSDVDLSKLLEHHKKEGKIATLTAVHLPNPYGVLELDEFEPHRITNFKEKPLMDDWINGGYFVFNKEIFNYIKEGEEIEKEVFDRLAKEKNLIAYRHSGFWKSMNTFKDSLELNEMFNNNELNNMFKKNG